MTAPSLVEIEAGQFTIGCTNDDKFCNPHELPRKDVSIRGFALGKYLVTESEFFRYAEPGTRPASDLPVVNISWHDAAGYCKWLSSQLGERYRLPTEAEWEYACRSGSQTPFPTGHLPDREMTNLYYDESGNRTGAGQRLPLGWGAPNPFGLHDMLGNACEWVEDDWAPDYWNLNPNGTPQITDSGLKVIRGGGWDAMPRLARSSFRDFAAPSTRRDNLGFRIAKDL